ncbi:hypothetical protein [Labrys neptuniae]
MNAHPEKLIGTISRPPGMGETGVGTVVKGHTMGGLAHNSVAFYHDDRTPPSAELLGELVIAAAKDGRRLARFLEPGSIEGRFNLRSVTGPLIENIDLEWAERVLWIRPPIYGDPLLKHSTIG